ncbi:Predicted flavoprotein CzcO associated with the cation diffusion facilitator CzcD [Sphingobium faniae]|nr:Predicted flavoprotein CzcO associated with the cation diffusion facilitator CzcD [Sphingobium faniae]
MQRKHFGIIGAGVGGLCTARHLLAAGFDVTIFEAGSTVGGLWVYNNDSGRSPAYRSLRINSEAKVTSFVDFPFRDDIPLYPGHEEMARYLRSYADRFDVYRHVRFRSEVTAVEPEGDGFRLTLRDGESFRFDGVVVATGHQSIPRHPPEIANFTGDYIHAHAYRVPEPYAGQRVLVIGPGNSGVDIASDICTVTDKTYLAARSPVLIMPRLMFGVPNSRVLGKIELPFLPWRARLWLRTMMTRIFHGTMESWGFRTPRTRTHAISHPTLISHIAWERIMAKPAIDRIDGRSVHFVDGSEEQIDAIIAATGYETDLPFLSEATSPMQGPKMMLYNRIVHPDYPGLYFVGYFDVTGGSNIRMMDEQAEYVAAVASGAIALPDPEGMKQAIEEDYAWQARQFPGSPRYALELDPVRYRKRLAADYARNGGRQRRTAPDQTTPAPPYAVPHS